LKPEWWGSPLVQEEKYQEKPVKKSRNNKKIISQYHDNQSPETVAESTPETSYISIIPQAMGNVKHNIPAQT
jgi:truncated hemoglobin YjbI